MHLAHPLAVLLLVPALAAVVWLRRNAAWRIAAAALAVFAAMGPTLGPARPPGICRIYVLDASDSVGGAGEALALAQRDARDLKDGDVVGIVLVADGVRVELSPSSPSVLRSMDRVRTTLGGGATRLGSGIEAGAALVPAGRQGEVVVISDGREVPGPAAGPVAAAAARRNGIRVRTLPCASDRIADVRLDRIEAPGRVRPGERFEAIVTVSSSFRTRARVTLGDSSREIALEPGLPSRVVFSQGAPSAAVNWLTATVEALDGRDMLPANNSNETAVLLDGPLPILVLSPDTGRPAQKAIAADARFSVESGATPDDLALAAAVVLDGIAAEDLPEETLRALASWVERGGGLLALGGPAGFGAGSWGETPLDPALPVESAPQDTLTLIVLLDASGSMNEDASPGRPKIAEARDALRGLARAARPGTVFAFAAFNNKSARWIAPPGPELAPLLRAIDVLDAGGGTLLAPALELALSAAGGRSHVVLLSDGQTAEKSEALAELAGKLRAKDASVTAVAAGADANRAVLELIAPGRVDTMREWGELARLLREDLAREQGLTAAGEFDTGGASKVLRVNLVKPREGASVVSRAGSHPLVVTRPYGLGRSAAFASALDPAWLASPEKWASTLTNLVAQVARPDPGGRLTLAVEDDDIVASWSPAAPGNAASVSGELTCPDGTARIMDLLRVAPGRFSAHLRESRTGRFVLAAGSTRAAAARSWPAEIGASGPRPDLLAALEGPAEGPPPAIPPERPIAPWFLLAAVAVVVAEAAWGAARGK